MLETSLMGEGHQTELAAAVADLKAAKRRRAREAGLTPAPEATPPRDTGERDRTPELRHRHGWAWLRIFRRYDTYQAALDELEEHGLARPRARAHQQLRRSALIVVDVQRGFDDAAYWGERDNPDCEANVAALIAAWRAAGWPIVFVRHDAAEPDSPLRLGQPGHEFKDVVTGEPDLLVAKRVNSCFYGEPDLHAWLHEAGLDAVTVCGITTNHCCETTVRMAGNLGYETTFVVDATHTFDRGGVPAAELSRISAINVDDEFATVRSTADVVAAVSPAR